MPYYRGDDFGGPPEPTYDPGFTESIQPYANAPGSAIREQELATGRDVAASGFTGGGGFLNQLGEVGKTFGLFFSPFLPILAPALSSVPVVGSVIRAASAAEKAGGVLRPIIEGITTAPGGTITERAATSLASGAPSGTSAGSPATSSALPPPPWGTSSPVAGPFAGRRSLAGRLPRRRARAPRSSRVSRGSLHLSRTQRGILSREVQRLLRP